MTTARYPDTFVIINGPEDGTEFPIVQSPFYAGANPQCAAMIRLDTAVQDTHARLSVTPKGYRVRRCGVGQVKVNGKSVGRIRSRILYPGDVLTIGCTALTVELAPDGLAQRSHGVPLETDSAWATRRGIALLLKGVRGVGRFIKLLVFRILSSWLSMAAFLFLLYIFIPPFRNAMRYAVSAVYGTIAKWLQ